LCRHVGVLIVSGGRPRDTDEQHSGHERGTPKSSQLRGYWSTRLTKAEASKRIPGPEGEAQIVSMARRTPLDGSVALTRRCGMAWSCADGDLDGGGQQLSTSSAVTVRRKQTRLARVAIRKGNRRIVSFKFAIVLR